MPEQQTAVDVEELEVRVEDAIVDALTTNHGGRQ